MRNIFRNQSKPASSKLTSYANQPNAIVLGLPRGGVPVAFEVAKALRVPLDVFVVRKRRETLSQVIEDGPVRAI